MEYRAPTRLTHARIRDPTTRSFPLESECGGLARRPWKRAFDEVRGLGGGRLRNHRTLLSAGGVDANAVITLNVIVVVAKRARFLEGTLGIARSLLWDRRNVRGLQNPLLVQIDTGLDSTTTHAVDECDAGVNEFRPASADFGLALSSWPRPESMWLRPNSDGHPRLPMHLPGQPGPSKKDTFPLHGTLPTSSHAQG